VATIFYQLHLLLDKHAGEQLELVDVVAERVQTLGGVAVGDPRHVAEITVIARPPGRGSAGRCGGDCLGEHS
jgi:starvation-inducible DNA-binding protein